MTGIIFILLAVGFGCAGPEMSVTDGQAAVREEACSSRQDRTQHNGLASKACRSQRAWSQGVGEALSGAAAALRP
jgi:hypothetical protein